MMEIAAIAGIHLRAGCFCNPGACQKHLRLCDSEYLRFYSEAGHVCGDYIDVVNGMPTGSVRASVGYYTRKCDIDMLYFAIRDYLHSLPPPVLPLIPNVVNNVPMNVDGQVDQLPMDLYLMTPTMRLTEIYVYPIKSCRGMAVCSWTLGNRGLLYDRYWMIVNSSGVSYTLKSNTELSRIEPFVDLERGLLVINCAVLRLKNSLTSGHPSPKIGTLSIDERSMTAL
ncbi:hypothetical protein J6590_062456 [Homalodisca vitripennis]|nr:hypothetical protein J6590_062456 [Homalodisca vitripennis]